MADFLRPISRKQLLETRGVFGGNVFINPARYILIDGEIKSNKS